jgi:hypothetical protein
MNHSPSLFFMNTQLIDIEAISCVKPKSEQLKRPDPTEPGFFSRCENPTLEEGGIATLAINLRMQVAKGLISQAEADRKLREHQQRLGRDPFEPDFHPMLAASPPPPENEIRQRQKLEDDIERKTGARPVPPKVRHGANSEPQSSDENNSRDYSGVKPPELDPIAYHGPLGLIVKKMEPETEAHGPALLIQALATISNVWGRAASTKGGARIHRANLFAVTVGDSSLGRKGEGLETLNTYVFPTVADEIWRKERIRSGAASGEGIIFHLRDATDKDAGANDKRLLIQETEFGGMLDVINRDGNKLSAILRAAWDGAPLDNLALRNRDEKKIFMRATNYHLSLNAHITRVELRKKLTSYETANGLANRILWVFSERTKLLPNGGNFSSELILDELAEMISAVEFGAKHWALISRDAEADELWDQFYREFHGRLKATPSEFGEIIRRGDAQALRLSLIFAVLDRSPVIRAEHIKAAIAVWDYCMESARWAFCETRFSQNAQKIYDFLELRPSNKATLTEIHSEVFKRHLSADKLRDAIAELEASRVVRTTAKNVKSPIRQQVTVELIA